MAYGFNDDKTKYNLDSVISNADKYAAFAEAFARDKMFWGNTMTVNMNDKQGHGILLANLDVYIIWNAGDKINWKKIDGGSGTNLTIAWTGTNASRTVTFKSSGNFTGSFIKF